VLALFEFRVVSCAVYKHRIAKAGSVAKENLHQMQLAIERFAVDAGGYYPEDAAELLTKGYLAEFPQNPYAGLLVAFPTLEHPRAMRPLKPGEQCPGDFLYVPERPLVMRSGGLTFAGGVESYILILSPNAPRRYWKYSPPLPPNIMEPGWKLRNATEVGPNKIQDEWRWRIISAYQHPSSWR